MKVDDPVETYFLLSCLQFTEDLNSVENKKPFCCPLRLDCLMAKENLAKNHGSGKYQLKSLGLFVPFFSPFSRSKRQCSCQTTSLHLRPD